VSCRVVSLYCRARRKRGGTQGSTRESGDVLRLELHRTVSSINSQGEVLRAMQADQITRGAGSASGHKMGVFPSVVPRRQSLSASNSLLPCCALACCSLQNVSSTLVTLAPGPAGEILAKMGGSSVDEEKAANIQRRGRNIKTPRGRDGWMIVNNNSTMQTQGKDDAGRGSRDEFLG
jgi:hypothetical protein